MGAGGGAGRGDGGRVGGGCYRMAAVGLCQLCSASFSALGSFMLVSDITGLVEGFVFTKKLLFRTRDQLQYSPAYTFNAYPWRSQWGSGQVPLEATILMHACGSASAA